MKRLFRKIGLLPLAALVLGIAPSPAHAIMPPGKLPLGGGDITSEELDQAYVQSFPQTLRAPGASPTALPDIFGPGAVLRAGNVVMKVTNIGIIGNPFATSTDPSGQWPGQSSIEYLNAVALAVGGVEQVNGQTIRRVTYSTEWRPPSLDPEDKIYTCYDGIVGGVRFFDDDGDGKIDEDFLDGRDNDGDGKIDEDYDAQGQQEFDCALTDYSPQSLVANAREQHVPLGIRVNQKAWAYSLTSPNLTNFNVIEFDVKNESGNSIDSLCIGWLVDFDAGPVLSSNYFQDDMDAPGYPQGKFVYDWTQGGQIQDPRVQVPHDLRAEVSVLGHHSGSGVAPPESALCQRQEIQINGFSIGDDDGDDGKTPGIPSFLLFGYTTDPTGNTGPATVQWRAFRSFTAGTPFNQGGNPTLDIERFEFMTGHDNIAQDGDDAGLINADPGDQKGDYACWASVGPWLQVPNGGTIVATVGVAVDRGTVIQARGYRAAYHAYRQASAATQGAIGKDLLSSYPSLNNAFTAQIAYEGVYEINTHFPAPDFHGRESGLQAPPGQRFTEIEQCGAAGGRSVLVDDRQIYWFDLDCNYCTGIWSPTKGGYFHRTWNTSSPPPSPITNASTQYNYTDNPDRRYVPGGDNQVTVAWDNLSEISPDPAPPNLFDFRGYKVWKVSDWQRPVGSPGPAEEDWSLIAEFRQFSYLRPDGSVIPNNLLTSPQPCAFPSGTVMSDTPCVFIPVVDSVQKVFLRSGDLWNLQTGQVIRPAPICMVCNPANMGDSLDCVRNKDGTCQSQDGKLIPPTQSQPIVVTRVRYPVGRYSFVDHNVKDGFVYFYSVTAFDSVNGADGKPLQTESRRSAVEAEGIVPQTSVKQGKGVTVVPNPYRGYASITQRPSSWDLVPNATDPTGTHIDFFGMPPGPWTLKIYTIAGDLVQTIHSTDAINAQIRNPVTAPNGNTYSGVTRQQDTANDGQATWNLISRNGQDVVSGVYLFTVNSKEGIQRGKFVIIR